MGIMFWITFDAFNLRMKDLGWSDEKAAEAWAIMSDPENTEADELREEIWGKDLKLLGEYIDKAIEQERKKS